MTYIAIAHYLAAPVHLLKRYGKIIHKTMGIMHKVLGKCCLAELLPRDQVSNKRFGGNYSEILTLWQKQLFYTSVNIQ